MTLISGAMCPYSKSHLYVPCIGAGPAPSVGMSESELRLRAHQLRAIMTFSWMPTFLKQRRTTSRPLVLFYYIRLIEARQEKDLSTEVYVQHTRKPPA